MRSSALLTLMLGYLASAPANACRMRSELNLNDVQFADVVVVGKIANYHIIRDEKFRQQMLKSKFLSAADKKFYADPATGLLPDYARFDVIVSRTLRGHGARQITVTWDNSTFGEPNTLPPGPYVIALRKPGGRVPPLRGPSATILPDPRAGTMAVLQAPCSSPFLFELGSREAQMIQAKLAGPPRR